MGFDSFIPSGIKPIHGWSFVLAVQKFSVDIVDMENSKVC